MPSDFVLENRLVGISSIAIVYMLILAAIDHSITTSQFVKNNCKDKDAVLGLIGGINGSLIHSDRTTVLVPNIHV